MARKQKNSIDPYLASLAFELDDSLPSGLRWKKGYGNTNSGKIAGCMVDRGYKIYWMLRWNGVPYYCHRIVWALKNMKDPKKLQVKA
jgi:hypothetical protein